MIGFRKKVALSFFVALALSGSASSAMANDGLIFGNLQTARVVGAHNSSFGGAVSIGDDATTIYGSLVYGFGMFTEGRLRLGLSDPAEQNSDPQVALGGELKYQFWNFEGEGVDDPFDMSFSGMFEWVDYNGFTLTHFGANVIGSRPFPVGGGRNWAPYGRLNLRLSSASGVGPNGDGDSDFGFSATGGGMFEFSGSSKVFGEITVDQNTALNLGIEFGF